MSKCILCEVNESMITTKYCIDCNHELNKYLNKIAIGMLRKEGLIDD